MNNTDIQAYRADGGDISAGRLKEIADNPYGDEEKCWMAKRMLALLDELEVATDACNGWQKKFSEADERLEAAEKRIAETNKHNAELTAKIEPMHRQVGELTMWVKRLAHSLRKAKPDSKLRSDAMDYLNRNGLISVEDVLR